MVLPRDLKSAADARVGTTLIRKYTLDKLLGVGGMATVYAATHRRNAKRVAIKVLHPHLSTSQTVREHFKQEGRAANTVAHPGAVQVDDDDVTEDGTAFLVMELLDGIGVEVLQRRYRGRLSVHAAVSIVEQMLDVLIAAHAKSIIHRDIKPANLFLIRDGSLKVLDFGIARFRGLTGYGSEPLTGNGEALGTPGFMGPEQALGRSDIDAQTDIWAASATLFNLISGELVHRGSTPQELRVCAARDPARPLESIVSSVPLAIAEVVNRGLAFVKGDRWKSATEMRLALRDAYVSTFGKVPERLGEAHWEPAAPGAGEEGTVGATIDVMTAVPPVPEPNLKIMTERPVESGAVPSRRPRRWSSVPLVAVGLMAMFAPAMTRWAARWTLQHVTAAGIVPGVASNAAAAGPVRRDDERDAGRVTATFATGDIDAGIRDASKPLPIERAILPTRNCDPPTWLDEAGIKYPKSWCL